MSIGPKPNVTPNRRLPKRRFSAAGLGAPVLRAQRQVEYGRSNPARDSEVRAMEAVFDLEEFLPYRLNRAGDAASAGFVELARARHHMTRPEWRVIAMLGRSGRLTAGQIVRRSGMHKTKVSRAVAALERRVWLRRSTDEADRRIENLELTEAGRSAFGELVEFAREQQAMLVARLGPERLAALDSALAVIMDGFGPGEPASDDS